MSAVGCREPFCGHPESEHYVYSLNGRDQSRCRACDPFTGRRDGNYAITAGSEEARMDKLADHAFQGPIH